MKSLLPSAAVLITMLCVGPTTVVIAQEGEATRPADESVDVRTREADTALDEALASLERRAANANLTREEFNELREALKNRAAAREAAGYSRATTDRDRLVRMIGSLEARALAKTLEAREVARLREHVIDIRLEEALDALAKRAKTNDVPRAQFNRLRTLLTARAEAAKAALPDVPNLRPTLTALIDDLEARYKAKKLVEPDVVLTHGLIVEARLGRALTALEKSTADATATGEDFAQARDLLEDRFALASRIDPSTPTATREAWMDALATLERRAKAAGVTREQFKELRDQLMRRAIAASSKK